MTGIPFRCTLRDVKTVQTGGFRVVLDLPETEADAASKLMKAYRNIRLQGALVPEPEEKP